MVRPPQVMGAEGVYHNVWKGPVAPLSRLQSTVWKGFVKVPLTWPRLMGGVADPFHTYWTSGGYDVLLVTLRKKQWDRSFSIRSL